MPRPSRHVASQSPRHVRRRRGNTALATRTRLLNTVMALGVAIALPIVCDSVSSLEPRVLAPGLDTISSRRAARPGPSQLSAATSPLPDLSKFGGAHALGRHARRGRDTPALT